MRLLFLLLEQPTDPILELLPPRTIQMIAQLSIIVHFRPAIPTPFAAGHVDHKVTIALLVMNVLVVAFVTAGTGRKTVDHALRHKGEMRARPGLIGVNVLESVLFFVLPLHVLLFVADGIPPDVHQAVGPGGAADEEGAEIETAAILWNQDVDRGSFTIANG